MFWRRRKIMSLIVNVMLLHCHTKTVSHLYYEKINFIGKTDFLQGRNVESYKISHIKRHFYWILTQVPSK